MWSANLPDIAHVSDEEAWGAYNDCDRVIRETDALFCNCGRAIAHDNKCPARKP